MSAFGLQMYVAYNVITGPADMLIVNREVNYRERL